MVQKQYIAKVIGVFPEAEVFYCSKSVFTLHLELVFYTNVASVFFWLDNVLAHLMFISIFPQQVVDVNVNYNAREGRSTTEVNICIR